jgi:3-phenylpropionate/cinnamic acid dioxygenase small subunit
MTRPASETAQVQFVLDEAKALNEGRYEDWLGLFADDGCYWVPLHGDRQPDPVNHASIAYEDTVLLAIRVRRIGGPRAHSMAPGVSSLHVVQQPRTEASDPQGDEYRVTTPFVYVEVKGERQLLLAGTWRHRLRAQNGSLRIVQKRVDLLNASAPHEAIHLFP